MKNEMTIKKNKTDLLMAGRTYVFGWYEPSEISKQFLKRRTKPDTWKTWLFRITWSAIGIFFCVGFWINSWELTSDCSPSLHGICSVSVKIFSVVMLAATIIYLFRGLEYGKHESRMVLRSRMFNILTPGLLTSLPYEKLAKCWFEINIVDEKEYTFAHLQKINKTTFDIALDPTITKSSIMAVLFSRGVHIEQQEYAEQENELANSIEDAKNGLISNEPWWMHCPICASHAIEIARPKRKEPLVASRRPRVPQNWRKCEKHGSFLALEPQYSGLKCQHCGYDLRGSASRNCPECGWYLHPALYHAIQAGDSHVV